MWIVILSVLGLPSVLAQTVNTIHPTKTALSVKEFKNQRKIFEKVELFGPETDYLSTRMEKSITKSTVAAIDNKVLHQIFAEKPVALELEIPFLGQSIEIELIKVDILDAGFQAFSSGEPGKAIKYTPGAYYRGIIKGDEQSTIAISFFDDILYGMISSGDYGNITLNKLQDNGDYLIYSDRDLTIKQPGICETIEPEGYAQEIQRALSDQSLTTRATKCVKVYIETDYALYQNKGNSTTNVINYMTAVFNNVATLYANEQITTQVSEFYVWTSADGYSKTSSTTALNQFKSKRPSYNGDIAHLAALGGNNLGGVAWVDALCSNYGYAYSNIDATYLDVPTYSWTIEVMTHEMGHNLGSPHTQSCSWNGGALDNCYTPEGNCNPGPPPTNGGTIMSYCHLTNYGINFNNGFGQQPGDLIRSKVNAATCLGECSNGSCNPPSGLYVNNIGTNTGTANWNSASGATAYQVRYRTGSGSWTTLSQTTNLYQVINGLANNTTYEVQVSSVCGSESSAYSASVYFTTGVSCGTVSGLNAYNITSTTASVSWNSVSGAVSYDLQYKLNSSSTWSTYNTTGTAVNFTNLTPNTTYNVRVRANCSSGSGEYSAIVNFTTLTNNGPTYCSSNGNNASEEWIDLVKLGSINNVTGSNNGYADFTALSTNLQKGSSYSITLSAGMVALYREYWTVWIDYNHDGDFNDSGEREVRFNATTYGNITKSFAVPSNALTGVTRMRVSMKYGSYPATCGSFSYGEVEDYSINIVASGGLPEISNTPIDNLTISPNPADNEVNLTFNAVNEGSINISISDLTGKTLKSDKHPVESGYNFIPLDISKLQPGVYLIHCQNENINNVLRVIKQ
jgi:hypothetical protein